MAAYRGRLVEYLPERADHYADLLPGNDARRWFSVEDTALLTVLRDRKEAARALAAAARPWPASTWRWPSRAVRPSTRGTGCGRSTPGDPPVNPRPSGRSGAGCWN
ncbi:MAG: hypothetical protein GEV11_05825 [Streptosporangiales bacterium]|nr:hypothetical protein [Streptosporangiales bacterium]